MDKETVSYIINYFYHLLTYDETAILTYRLCDNMDQHRLTAAQRLLAEAPEQILLNNCPRCGTLARTPWARQCRHCKHSWRKSS